jgi:hypothetical protein
MSSRSVFYLDSFYPGGYLQLAKVNALPVPALFVGVEVTVRALMPSVAARHSAVNYDPLPVAA